MPTRMDRYYRSESESKRRTSRNEDLYKTIYESSEYSNIEGITSIGNTNEIDIRKLKEMLQSREDYQRQKEYRNIVKREKPIEIPVIEEENDRTYDIRDILSKAKTERTDDHRDRSLKNTQYNILKNLNLNEKPSKYTDLEKENQELKELINTITSTSMLNKMNDGELSLDIFDDLKSTGDSMSFDNSVKEKVEEEKQNYVSENTSEGIDQSFFTSSLGLNEKDFQDYEDFTDAKDQKNSLMIKLLIGLLLVVVVAFIFFFLMSHQAN